MAAPFPPGGPDRAVSAARRFFFPAGRRAHPLMQRSFVRPLAQPAEPRVAVVGAGMSGLACAQQLLAAGLHPRVFERGRTTGGRCGTRETEAGQFDHGAQEFHDAPGAFSDQIVYWIENGMALDWRARVVDLDMSGGVTRVGGARLVGVPSMQALSDDLARGVDLVVDAQVRRLVRDANGHWFVEMRGPRGDLLDGPFETAVVAVAASQAVPLLAEAPLLQTRAGAIETAPVWTLLAAYAQRLDVPFDVALPDDGIIGSMARDSAKPGRSGGERWVVHATPAWSIAHLDHTPEEVRALMLARFEQLARSSGLVPTFLAVHRWRYAVALSGDPGPYWWDGHLRLGVCGDWFGADAGPGTVARAFVSGDALGLHVAHTMLAVAP